MFKKEQVPLARRTWGFIPNAVDDGDIALRY
jgi:hypothetical protein